MPETAERQRRPRGAGSIQWKGGRPYAVYRDVLTGKQTWTGFDTEEEADAFLAQWAADKKAARVAAKAAAADARLARRSAGRRARWSRGRSGRCSPIGRTATATASRSPRCATTARR